MPSITRKTDKRLPRYDDAGSDVFVLSGGEGLVPLYRQDQDGSWIARTQDTHGMPTEPGSAMRMAHSSFMKTRLAAIAFAVIARIDALFASNGGRKG